MSTDNLDWDLETDVIVVGAGGAGLTSAIYAHDAGARVLVLEKMPRLGGITVLAGGGIKAVRDAKPATEYLTVTQGGRVSDDLIQTFAEGLEAIPDQLRDLAKVNGAVVEEVNEGHSGIYDFPGRETIFSIRITDIPGFTGYDWAHTGKNLYGQRFFKILLDNVQARDIPIMTDAPARSLIKDNSGHITGVITDVKGRIQRIKARRGVVLASGGFEFNEKLKREYFDAVPIYAMGNPGNTGDGILMAQKAGAALWHMWHYHGSYGFKFPDYGAAFRIAPGGARNNNRSIAWILLDKDGRRFMNELHPACQDTAGQPLGYFDPDREDYPRIPSLMIFDEPGRRIGRIANPLTTNPDDSYEWSDDNLAEVERGWIKRYETLADLAADQGLPVNQVLSTVARWNEGVVAGEDPDHRRPPGTMVQISEGPFYAVPVWPLLTNTQGGPEHDRHQRIVDPFGEPIPSLYAAGECGSFFAHLYLLGGNLSELLISGRIAGRHAAAQADWEKAKPARAAREGLVAVN